MKSFCILLLLIFSANAYSDSPQEFTIAVTCDAKHKVFSLDPVVSSVDEGTLLFEGNGSELPEEKRLFECKLSKNHSVKLSYEVIPPRMQGMCGARGLTQIHHIFVNDLKVYGASVINNDCFAEKSGTLISLKISIEGSKLKLRSCNAKNWDNNKYIGRSCTTKNLKLASPTDAH